MASGYQPSRDKYKCPVKDCSSEYRGDDIPRHFQKCADLTSLDSAIENQSKLIKNLQASAIVELSEEYLKGLLVNSSISEKEHTLYLLQHDYSSKKLPNFNSINFKCQQKKEQEKTERSHSVPTVFQNFFLSKKAKISDESSAGPSFAVHEVIQVSDSNITSETGSSTNTPSEKTPIVENPIFETPMIETNTVPTSAQETPFEPMKKLESPQFIEELACKIASKVVQLQASNEQKQKELDNSESFWIESEEYWICNPCLFHSKSANIPHQLIVNKRGNFGYVGKIGQKPSHIALSKLRHTEKPLHLWCIQEYQREVERKNIDDRRNDLAGRKIVRNALFCFTRSLGSGDFETLNLKDFLAEKDLGSKMYNIATRNDSRAEFFRLRNVIFELLTEKTKNFFKEVKDIAVTLDKVTVQRTSFTVIMTYFFCSGKIHVVLNKLHKLSTKEYDGVGTANMLISTLCETLGVTRTKLSQLLKHLVYDGVYASPEERVAGGGSLDLKNRVCEALGIGKSIFLVQNFTTRWKHSDFDLEPKLVDIFFINLSFFPLFQQILTVLLVTEISRIACS